MATFFIVCLVLVSYSSVAGASPASIAFATPRLDRLGDDDATSPSIASLHPPAVYNKHLSLLEQAIREPATPSPPANSSFPVSNDTYSSNAEIPIELLNDIFTSLVAIGSKTGGPSHSANAAPVKDGMAATYDENVTSNGFKLISPSTGLTLLYLFLVSAIVVNVYHLGCFRFNVLVLCLLLYGLTIWVLLINDMLPAFSKYLW